MTMSADSNRFEVNEAVLLVWSGSVVLDDTRGRVGERVQRAPGWPS